MSDPFDSFFGEMDAHFDTLEIVKSFDKDTLQLRRKFSVGNRNQKIYHYTSLSKLESMLKTNELWFTHRDFVNDILENSYPSTLVETILSEPNSSEQVKKYIQKSGSGSHYIFCLTTEKDLANHWLSYARKEGYCLVFSRSKLSAFLREQKFDKAGNGKVVYEKDIQSDLLRLAISYLEKLERFESFHSSQPKIKSILTSIEYYNCLSKKKNYKCEYEYRYVVIDSENAIKSKVRVLNGIAVPYISVGGLESPKLPIEGVIVGPEINDRSSKKGILELFNSYGYDFTEKNVRESEIQIR